MLPMQFSTYLCNIGKTCIYPAISLSPLGMVMGLDCSWDSVAVTGEPASWLSGHGILRSLSVLPCQGNSVYLHRKLAANPQHCCSAQQGRLKYSMGSVLFSAPVTGPFGWGRNWLLSNHTQFPIHSVQRLHPQQLLSVFGFQLGCLDPAPRDQLTGDICDTGVPIISDLNPYPQP